jgi:prolipoprotein diacylglyceryltransferase
MFSIYLALNGIERFFVEKIRVNIRYDLLGIEVTQAEVIATFLFLFGITGIVYFTKKYKSKKSPS